MFVPAVIDENANVLVINLANDDVVFRQRIDEMFPTLSAKDYRFRDFGAFCDKFMSDAERRGLTGFLKNKGQVAIVSKPTVVSEPDQRPSENEGLDSQS
jgi:hypothetical protein